MFIGTTIYALINTAILALMAIGFNLTFGISGIANFAYGALYVLAAYGIWMMLNLMHLPYLVAVAAAVIFNLILGALIYRFVLIRVRGQGISEVIATFGIGLAVLELFSYFGWVGFEYTLPVLVDRSYIIAGTYVDMQRILILVFSIILILGLWFFTHHTSIGLAFRGIAQDERTALTFGIDADWIATLSVSFGAALAALAALFIIPLGSTGGVIVASFIVGFAERFTDTYIGSHWTMIVSLAALLIVLIVKPSGLFGKQKELEERI